MRVPRLYLYSYIVNPEAKRSCIASVVIVLHPRVRNSFTILSAQLKSRLQFYNLLQVYYSKFSVNFRVLKDGSLDLT